MAYYMGADVAITTVSYIKTWWECGSKLTVTSKKELYIVHNVFGIGIEPFLRALKLSV